MFLVNFDTASSWWCKGNYAVYVKIIMSYCTDADMKIICLLCPKSLYTQTDMKYIFRNT